MRKERVQMQERAGTITLLAEPEVAQAAGWQARAVREYGRSLPARRAGLRTDLAARILELTGQHITPDEIYVDVDGSMALAGVDGTTFRLYRRGGLVLVRPCAYCGMGHFESLKITDLADLGYALGHGLSDFAWRPLHEDCEDYYGAEDPSAW
jgi:hypothetical protein